ncbi:MAG TPA: C2 family cysteine protease [Polyangiaceae bacterium]|nr:C2 family cysteine protease [Polyangiaceae bacterium]
MTTSIDINAVRRRSDYPEDGAGAPPSEPSATERDERAAALERYESLVSQMAPGAAIRDPCEWLGPGPTGAEAVPYPALFVRQNSDANAIDLHDIKQGYLGDCYVLATLGGLTRTSEGRAIIQNAIQENRSATGEVVSYTVTLHQPERPLLGLGPTTFKDVKVTVSAAYVTGHAFARTDANTSEVWPLVMERAYAAYDGPWALCGGVVSSAMQIIIGKEAKHIGLSWYRGSYSADRLAGDLAAGKIVTFATKRDDEQVDGSAAAHYLRPGHAYLVTGTQTVDGELYVTLHNPWDRDEPEPVAFDELKRWFAAVDIGTVR